MASGDVTLDDLVQQIVSDPGVASGETEPVCSVTKSEALVVLEDFYRGHDEADRSLPVVAEGMGRKIACAEGCSTCCESLVLISVPEAQALALALEGHEARDRVLERARAWAAAHGERARDASDALRAGKSARYQRLSFGHALDRIMCPVNEEGRCLAYDARPLPCRQSWALDTPAYCVASTDPNTPQASLITHEKYEDLLALGRQVSAGLQAALGQGVDRQSLVLRLLDELEKPD